MQVLLFINEVNIKINIWVFYKVKVRRKFYLSNAILV